MAESVKNVLVFGPTGGVGRAAALAASKRGSHVWLAMRDTSKTIQGLEESDGKFSRVQADLSEPTSLTAAVRQSGATAAFVYTLHQSPDHMKASFEALKEAGVKYVVLLSSYGVKGDAANKENERNHISRIHARTEVAASKSGIVFTAIRPAYFNTNLLWNKAGIIGGEVEILCPSGEADFIAPADIGTVAGTILSKAQATPPFALCGPKIYAVGEAYRILGKVLGKEIKVKEINEEQFLANNTQFPKPIAESIVNQVKDTVPPNTIYPKERYEAAVGNVRTYGEIEPTTFEEWIESNKEIFA